jgi:hypothetical protein
VLWVYVCAHRLFSIHRAAVAAAAAPGRVSKPTCHVHSSLQQLLSNPGHPALALKEGIRQVTCRQNSCMRRAAQGVVP